MKVSDSKKPLRILILGGTGFLGQSVVTQCLAMGYSVTVCCRGQTPDFLPKQVERRMADRHDPHAVALSLENGRWDVCIDMSGYLPMHVRHTASLLRERVSHYIYISAVKAFEPQHHAPLTESSRLHSPIDEGITQIDNRTYGPLKSTSEQIVRSIFTQRATILRPQVIIGPHDCSGRLAYWLFRSQQKKTPLLPGRGDDHLQVVDVMDVAAFIITVIQNRLFGDFNLAGEKVSWQRFVQLLNIHHGQWVASETIAEAGLSFRALPLYRVQGSTEASYMNIDNRKARAHGFTVTDLTRSIARYTVWLSENAYRIPADIYAEWLTPEHERALVKMSTEGSLADP